MNEQTKHSDSWITIVLIGAVVAAGAIVTTFKRPSISDYVSKSGNIVAPRDNAFSKWFGKEAPDFTITDLNGNRHSLSDYRGRNVMVVFWATWCPHCNAEIPDLMELTKQEGDNLAILALSSEDSQAVKKFVEARKINYTAASLGNGYLPSPFVDVEYLPTSFFIDPDGRIKAVLVQSLTLEQMNTIMEAKTTVNDNSDS